MKAWHDIMSAVLFSGQSRIDRTGVGTLSLFGTSMVVDNAETFPAVTTKKLAFKQVAAELACFIQGFETLEQFHSMGCHIWDANGNAPYWKPEAYFPAGYLGRIYGVQWRKWRYVKKDGTIGILDQLQLFIDNLKKDPFSRRHLLTTFNPGEIPEMCLPPCHVMAQAYVRPVYGTSVDGIQTREPYNVLDFVVTMRSVDLFLGLPFDIASYAILQRLVAKEVGMVSGKLHFHFGDSHIYLNHIQQVKTVLEREPMKAPTLSIADANLFSFKPEQAVLVEYESHDAVKAEMNV